MKRCHLLYHGSRFANPHSRPTWLKSYGRITVVDNTVVSGTTYYYVTTAVDSAGVESAFSSQVIATIPVP